MRTHAGRIDGLPIAFHTLSIGYNAVHYRVKRMEKMDMP